MLKAMQYLKNRFNKLIIGPQSIIYLINKFNYSKKYGKKFRINFKA